MKNYLALGFALSCVMGALAGPVAAQDKTQDKTIVFATEAAYPPFNLLTSDGKIVGFDVDIAMAACEKMKRTCAFVQQDWDGIVAGLQTRRYDAIFSSMGITEERKKQLLFTDPYYRPSAAFVGTSDVKVDFKDPALGGATVGAVPGIYECYVKKAYPKAKLTVYPNSDALYLDLTSGRIDLAFNGMVAITNSFLKSDDGKGFALVGEPVRDAGCLGEGAGVAMRKDDVALKEALDKAFKDMRADGTYKAINDKYFTFDIYE
ncbi:transporter substrate-binding domain-containing protein [Ancylobacter sp. 6x-1]|uniref:Transporter substrate-binding domain-containing protein n=1 Tax=Ancylobacter crimeensis TaxID=2579147 RepID=A0ABT0DC11_9HYPH|nr:transporter substrate-binding domain-containing protein [Ancylobacter crimeensis]MCK0197439.1 transporter substrate-binding domain-containing protein [Ancylobacter crimeensis]